MAELMLSQAPIVPSAGVVTDLYTVPSGEECAVSSIIICNPSDTASAKVSVKKAYQGAADAVTQYWLNDYDLGPNETYILSPNGTLSQTDKIRVSSDIAGVCFDINGTRIS